MPQGSLYERQFKHHLEDAGFDVIRSAGSLAVDLVAVREIAGVQRAFLFEVKSFKTKRFYPSHDEKTKLQWAEMKRLEGKFWKRGKGTIHVYYALHKKNDGWMMALPSNLNKPELHSDPRSWFKSIKAGGMT